MKSRVAIALPLLLAACGPLDLGGAADLSQAAIDAPVAGSDAPETPPDLDAAIDLGLGGPPDLWRAPDLSPPIDLLCVAHIVAAPAVIDFGKVPAGAPSMRLPLTLTNDSLCQMRITSAQLGGPDAAAFQVEGLKLAWPVPPGQSFDVGVWLMAPAGTYKAVLEIGTDIPTQPRVLANLTGSCVKGSARITADVARASFGVEPVGVMSAWQFITLTSAGLADLHIARVTLGGLMAADFALDTGMLQRNLPMGSATRLAVAFRPLGVGARAATASIDSDDPLTPTLVIPLDGLGK